MRIIERYSKHMRIFMGRGGWSLLAPLRYILSLLYGIYARAAPDAGTVRAAAYGPRIISVGNIEVGGGGKTPCVLAIAAELSERGMRPAVVTRGYGGSAASDGGAVALPEGAGREEALPPGYILWRGDAEEEASRVLGDEAVLYLRAALPLAVDRDRKRGIEAIIEAAGPTHVILDDAFHRKDLRKDLDILLLDAERPFGNGRLLPYGTLREPPPAASRAGAVVFTRAAGSSVPPEAAGPVGDTPVFFARHMPAVLSGRGGEEISAGELEGARIALFSGIARPSSFERSAAEFGLDPEVSFRYDDHHGYSSGDVAGMIEECGRGSVFITTGKDWVKVSRLFPDGVRLLRLDMRMEISGMEALLGPVL